MSKKMTFEWHLRMRMAERGMFQTSELVTPLAERGISLSREQVYRLVTTPPQRLSMDVFAALCDILGCEPNERSLRFGLERGYRALARLTSDRSRRIELVDMANAVRPKTWS